MSVTITRAGFLATVQDLGRGGAREFGVSVGGALDSHGLRVANLLAGNEESAAGLELTSGNVRLRFEEERIIAWAGGEYDVVVAGRAIPAGHSALIAANQELSISGPRRGCRAWVAISGGIDVPRVLDSRSTDLRANFGGFEGRRLRDGDVLPLGEISKRAASWLNHLRKDQVAHWTSPHDWSSPASREPVLRVLRGVDWDRFDGSAQCAIFAEPFSVSADSDRMGARLEGVELKRCELTDLISEAVVPGTVQVPASGNPILLLGDCQTIGGYPKIAHVITVDMPIAAQLGAGDVVRFREVALTDAHRLLAARARDLQQFRCGIELQVP